MRDHEDVLRGNMTTPVIPKEVVEFLERKFPDRLPSRHELKQIETGEVAFKAGQVDVVRFLRNLYAEQEDQDFIA